MQVRDVLFAAALALAPLSARAADLVVWWDKAFYPEEDRALADLARAFETKTGLSIELVRHNNWETPKEIEPAIMRGQPPDFLFAFSTPSQGQFERWAAEDRLVDLADTIGGHKDFFDKDILDLSTFADAHTGRRGLYALPMGRDTNHIHVWFSLLERAGFQREDIPTEWEPFWSFWCDKVQPAVRRALGRQDIWAVGAPMSAAVADTGRGAAQFVYAYTEAWPTPTGPSLLHDPAARMALVNGLAAYTTIWKKDCTPPDAANWGNNANNQAFLAQRVVMTVNPSLSIPAALRMTRPDDYYRNVITISWPKNAFGQPERIDGRYYQAMVFRDGGHTAAAKEFVRFLVEDAWLETYLTSAGDRFLPVSQRMLEQPFWLDPGDPHRLRSAVQVLSQPHVWLYYGLDREQAARLEREGPLWGFSTAVHRVVADGLSPEEAANEAIERVKQILRE